MNRSMLININDINAQNIYPILVQAESLKLKMPDNFDGWYVSGLCYYKMGNTSESLYNLTQAYALSPEQEILKILETLKGTPKKTKQYKMVHDLKRNNGVIMTIVIFILTFFFIYNLR